MMVVFGLSSLRGAAMNFRLFSKLLKDGLPCWTVIQNWVLRFGLYKLQEPLPRRDDWILIADHTIEFGAKNCLVVLAVSAAKLRERNFRIGHEDVEVAAIKVGDCSKGDEIANVLTEVSEQIGLPAQIVSDAASNLKSGFRTFEEQVNQRLPDWRLKTTYDITHKAANCLKGLLENDKDWNAFTGRIAATKRNVVHTEFAAYAPNKPRDKSRWQNLETHVVWAEAVLNRKGKHGHPSKAEEEWLKKFKSHFDWVGDYRRQINLWRLWLDVINAAKQEVKLNGLSRKTAANFRKRADEIKSRRVSVRKLKRDLEDFFRNEAQSLPSDEGWLGSSDIIESIFGKYKTFSAKTPMKEVGKAVLTIPVLTSKLSPTEVKRAMEAVPDKMLKAWLAENVGESLLGKRKKVFLPQKQKIE